MSKDKLGVEINVEPKRVSGKRDKKIYGHFIEHFHRQIYNGIYDPESPLSDEDGFRTDIIEAVKKIDIPILRWPGGCFVSSYHWKDAVGKERKPLFDKAWRVEDPNTFGTDEYIKMCEKIGCEPYICTNAGTGTAEEMSDWVEYCNLENEGQYAKWRIENGNPEPFKVKYWSIGNENYGHWEIGAKSADEWGKLVREAAKMIKHVDPETELSAAALSDLEWNVNLLKNCGEFLDWISIHEYWDMVPEENDLATYEQCMAFTKDVGHAVDEVRGLLKAMKLDKKIKIAFDEWNLRSWHHPNVHTIEQGVDKKDYLDPRDKNDDNSQYTMADAVFTACFLNAMNRNCDIVGMANFAPVLNTRGCIYSYDQGIVLRTTYHVFDLYVNYLGDTIIDLWTDQLPQMTINDKQGNEVEVESLDLLATKWSDKEGIAIAAVNKDPQEGQLLDLSIAADYKEAKLFYISGENKDSYNDVDKNEVKIIEEDLGEFAGNLKLELKPHSVNIIQLK
ncbi:alpha-L-arabinofuranosidase C-terminal domain-containing protein [Halanaerobium sp. ST460_2HS_T2]|jgi:alpha-N-arabinofuranosidase|uniref:alpha-L-arabinofuranosidase C-terminal domain-containing protein n=1 Tax=Halanaerobium sp. ST460_2HS_T2 TaxID=2183914 RepID=UPI000DF39153|nr:alpha-L-arabinofuranosidase C-terminal domain-containing protein [Halanaerobium sp. ST460_2HS_T2]RCW61904.1 alpha-N-arabinofuranosidase [Halanaerobium sp. ST460_2HS_T2]